MLPIEVDTGSAGILVDKIEYKKARYLIFWKFVAKIIRSFNVYKNTFLTNCYY